MLKQWTPPQINFIPNICSSAVICADIPLFTQFTSTEKGFTRCTLSAQITPREVTVWVVAK